MKDEADRSCAPELAEAVANVLREFADEAYAPTVAAFFLDLADI